MSMSHNSMTNTDSIISWPHQQSTSSNKTHSLTWNDQPFLREKGVNKHQNTHTKFQQRWKWNMAIPNRINWFYRESRAITKVSSYGIAWRGVQFESGSETIVGNITKVCSRECSSKNLGIPYVAHIICYNSVLHGNLNRCSHILYTSITSSLQTTSCKKLYV